MNSRTKKVNSKQRMRSSTSDGNLPSTGSRSFSQSASGSSDLDPETRGAKKRKSQHGEVYTSCEVCSEKDEKIKELTENLEHFKIGKQQKRQAGELESMKARYHEMKRKYEAERDAKDNAILRLSKLTSSRLRDNNPNIADLSDQYRPTKLAEMYSEIYDNEWTDAFEGLDDVHLSEEDKINFLLELIMFVYKECKEMVERQLQTLVNMIVGNDFTDINCVPQEIKDIFKGIKDYRKSHAIDTINTIQKHIEETQQVKYLDIQRVKVYFEACVKLCWLAVHQDPPVVLDIQQDPSASFDHKKFQEYTKRGPYVEFVVWPAMLLHQNGALLRKGVAQGAQSAGKLCHLI